MAGWQRRVRRACAAVTTAVALTCAAQAGSGVAAATAPRPTHDVAMTLLYDLPDTTTYASCPGPRVSEALAARRKLNMAAAQLELVELSRLYADRAAGIYSCAGAYTLTVHRIPGSREFDDAVRATAARHRVRISFENTSVSRLALAVVRQAVMDRSAVLAARGADLLSVRIDPEGFVEVGVAGSPRAARGVLDDVADRTRVVQGFLGLAADRPGKTAGR